LETKKKPLGKILIFLLFGLAIVWVIILSRAKYTIGTMPKLGEKNISINGDTIYHQIDTFTLKSQFGTNFGSDSLKGKIYLANFFFTSCPEVCPAINSNINLIQLKFKEVNDVMFVSFTVDPETDTFQKLAEYAAKYGKPSNWRFLTGPKFKIYDLAEYSYLSISHGASKANWAHTELLTLIDETGKIRGVYEGRGDQRVINEIIDGIKLLRIEKQNKK